MIPENIEEFKTGGDSISVYAAAQKTGCPVPAIRRFVYQNVSRLVITGIGRSLRFSRSVLPELVKLQASRTNASAFADAVHSARNEKAGEPGQGEK